MELYEEVQVNFEVQAFYVITAGSGECEPWKILDLGTFNPTSESKPSLIDSQIQEQMC